VTCVRPSWRIQRRRRRSRPTPATRSRSDISDGATWANKAELGVIVSRQSPHDRITEIRIRKVKLWETGRLGDAYLTFDDRLRAFV
jgi:hypothetical protein